ncbi:PREDICTED: uncharacterized protein LOC109116756 [Tarenaya hassleriana]|uniref:uncharacterized protein LOC109116756 n=1 Tax=Tarenaya hassleriana TaxID=28532 RepID=UPI0008FD4B70|nr:PREDICTED: uncharacterized protein LOC109116756 [Tarenaya hassleriana]
MAITKNAIISFFMLVTVSLFVGCVGTTHKIEGWAPGVDYYTWVTSRHFQVGDSLVFEYNKDFHDVTEVASPLAFEFCDLSSTIARYKTGYDVVNLTRPGRYYYVCGAPVTLYGDNYLSWSRSARMFLKSKGWWDHVTTTKNLDDTPEATISEADSKWLQEDHIVVTVLQSSFETSILTSFNHIESAKLLWDTLKEVFGNVSNINRIYEVKSKISSLRQEEKSFQIHLGEFTAFWSEFRELRQPPTDQTELAHHEQDKIFALLFSLNGSYKDLIQSILREPTLPTFNEICARIKEEEGGKSLFSGTSEIVHKARVLPDESAYKAGQFRSNNDRKSHFCEYCKHKGHLKDKCWQLHPHLKPQRYANTKSSFKSARLAGDSVIEAREEGLITIDNSPKTTSGEYVTKMDLEAMMQHFTSNISKMIASKDLGNVALTSFAESDLIIDSGATSHMIYNPNLLSDIKHTHGSVSIANGQTIPIKGTGKLTLCAKETDALYVPDFTNNLLSVYKVARDLDCNAIFGPNGVKFQDIKTGRIIAQGRTANGLYLLEMNSKPAEIALNSIWHDRLGIVMQSFPFRKLFMKTVLTWFHSYIKTQYNANLKCLRSDNGGELPTRILQDQSPFEVLNKTRPSLDFLKTFGCLCYVLVSESQRSKLDSKSLKDVKFLEELSYFDKKGWTSLEVESETVPDYSQTLKVLLHNDESQSFHQTDDHRTQEPVPEPGITEAPVFPIPADNLNFENREVEAQPHQSSEPDDEPRSPNLRRGIIIPRPPVIPLRRSTRQRKPSFKLRDSANMVTHPIQQFCSLSHLPLTHQCFLSKIDQGIEPQTFEEANKQEVWRKAMEEEISALQKNGTWDIVPFHNTNKLSIVGGLNIKAMAT